MSVVAVTAVVPGYGDIAHVSRSDSVYEDQALQIRGNVTPVYVCIHTRHPSGRERVNRDARIGNDRGTLRYCSGPTYHAADNLCIL